MSRRLSVSLLAATVALTPIPLIATITPAAAQVNVNVNIGFDYFYDQLAPYGEWHYHPRWGDVWQPTRVGPDFRPYFRGYWVNTEFGWTWQSEEPWGDATYHYGRWVYDPYDGWLWVPGYTWAPAWVVWRGGGGNIGWFPMPPDDRFLAGVEVYRDDWNWDRGYFGYADWYGPSIATGLMAAWTFVALDHFADRDYYRYAYDRPRVVNVVNNTTNITNYVTVNNRIVNRSIDVDRVERAAGRQIQRVEARNVVRTPITTVETGREVKARERERHGGNVRASARERVERLTAAEARTPVRERRNARFQRDDQQQAQQPGAPQQGRAADRAQERAQQQQDRRAQQQQDRDAAQRAQTDQRERNAAQEREERAQQQQRERDNRAQIERQQRDQAERAQADQRDRAAAQQREERAQQQQRERDNRAQIERQRQQTEQQTRARAEQQQRAQAEQQQRAEQQNRARAEQAQQRAAQQNRARAEQAQQRAEQQNRARAEQQQRAQAERQAQAEQQNRARAQQAERQQQQAAAQQQRQRRAQQQEEEEKQQRRGRN
jgi:hypothetical protein